MSLMLRIVGRMPVAVIDRHCRKIERRDAVKTGNVDAELGRVRAPLMVRIDAADTAKIMFGDAAVELIFRKLVGAGCDVELQGG